jgi:hypothetical protein
MGTAPPGALSQVPEGAQWLEAWLPPSMLAPVLARAHVILSMVCEAHHELPATAVERLIHQDHGRR